MINAHVYGRDVVEGLLRWLVGLGMGMPPIPGAGGLERAVQSFLLVPRRHVDTDIRDYCVEGAERSSFDPTGGASPEAARAPGGWSYGRTYLTMRHWYRLVTTCYTGKCASHVHSSAPDPCGVVRGSREYVDD